MKNNLVVLLFIVSSFVSLDARAGTVSTLAQLQTAMNSSAPGDTNITMLNDISNGSGFITSSIPAGAKTLDGGSHKLSGAGGGFRVTNAGTVLTIKDVTFLGTSSTTAALRGDAGTILTEGSVSFTDNERVGGGNDGGATIFLGATFTANGQISFDSNSASGSGTGGAGGAIFANNKSNITFNDEANFYNNTALSNGGALYLSDADTITTFNDRSYFTSNSAANNGGALYLTNRAQAIFDGLVTLGDVDPGKGNSATNGGAVFAHFSSKISFNGGYLWNNRATNNGGAVILGTGATADFNGTTHFWTNTAGEGGGAIYADGSATSVNFTGNGDVDFEGNTAKEGGAVVLTSGARATFGAETATSPSTFTFTGNTATNAQGGALLANQNSIFTFGSKTSAIFTNNTAVTNGGAVILGSGAQATFNGAATFTLNSAAEGGALYVTSATSRATFNGASKFENNTANTNGGAIVVGSQSGIIFNGKTDILSNTSTTGNGGGLYLATLTLASFNGETIIKGNKTLSSTKTGGGIMATNGANVGFTNTTTFESNESANGGGLMLTTSDSNKSSAIFTGDATFKNNTALTGNGGGILVNKASTLVFGAGKTAKFEGNTANDGRGGAIFISDAGTTATFNGPVDFINNTSKFQGGAVSVTDGAVLSMLGGGSFTSNEATAGNGGAIYNNHETTINGGFSFTNNSATINGGAIYNNGTLTLTSNNLGNIVFTGNTAAGSDNDIYNDGGAVNINGAGGDVNLGGGIAGTGTIAKSGSGRLVINGDSDAFTGTFTQTAGTTVVGAKFFGGTNTLSGGTLDIRTDVDIGTLSVSGATIDMTQDAGYHTLTISDYTPSNAALKLKTTLGSDAAPTDILVLNGGSSITGETVLELTTTGTGDFTNDGIKLVSAENGTTLGTTAFRLLGNQVDSGVHVYKLFQGDLAGTDNQSFFLRNTQTLSNIAETMQNMPALHLSMVKTGMNSLRKRLGELRDEDPLAHNGAWVRSYAKDLEVDERIKTDMTIFGAEAGLDAQVSCDACDNPVYVGVMAGYMHSGNMKTRQTNGFDGSGSVDTYSVGAYATWLNSDGWFVDATTRWFDSNMKVDAFSAQGNAVIFHPDRNFITASLEVGKRFEIYGDWCDTKWTIEPKAEIQYAYAKAKSFGVDGQSSLRYGHTQSILPKAGLNIAYNKDYGKGYIVEPFIEAMIGNELDGQTHIRYQGVPFESNVGGMLYEFSAGMNAHVRKNVGLYFDVSYETGKVYSGFGGNIGIRLSF